MLTEQEAQRVAEIEGHIQTAWDEVTALNLEERRWTMRIPAQAYDSDVVIGNVLKDAEWLLALVRRLADAQEGAG